MKVALQDPCHLRHAQGLPLAALKPSRPDRGARGRRARRAGHLLRLRRDLQHRAARGCTRARRSQGAACAGDGRAGLCERESRLPRAGVAGAPARAPAASRAPSDRARRRVDPKRRRRAACSAGRGARDLDRAQLVEPVDARERREQAPPDNGDAIVATPPKRTAGTAPTSAAATPDSNAPSSFEALMKTISTAFTRPRSSSGVTSGRIVERRTTLTRSKPPASASASIESHISRESPNTTMHAPNAGDDQEQRAPRSPPDRATGEEERRREGSHCRARSEGARGRSARPRGCPSRRSGEARPRRRAGRRRDRARSRRAAPSSGE